MEEVEARFRAPFAKKCGGLTQPHYGWLDFFFFSSFFKELNEIFRYTGCIMC